MFGLLVAVLLVLTGLAYGWGRRRAVAQNRATGQVPHSRPVYHGLYIALWCGGPAVLILLGWLAFEPTIIRHMVLDALPGGASVADDQLSLIYNEIRNVARHGLEPSSPMVATAAAHYHSLSETLRAVVAVVVLAGAILALLYARRRITPTMRARNAVEKTVGIALLVCSTLAVFTTLGIVLSLLFESLLFFRVIPVLDFLFGLSWNPQVDNADAFGAVPLFMGTLLVSLIAMIVAVPLGLMSAVWLAEYAKPKARAFFKPMLEVLAGIPTVVFGFFAVLVVGPFLRDFGGLLGLNIMAESAIVAGLVMGMMIIPFISSLSDDVITAVPRSLREGSLGLGATPSETIRRVILPAALPGIVGGVLLAMSRAIGETMIVVMAAGLSANLTANPFETVTTVTVQIVTLLVGDAEFDSPKTLAAFALGLMLFVVTLALNVIALHVVRKYREQYD